MLHLNQVKAKLWLVTTCLFILVLYTTFVSEIFLQFHHWNGGGRVYRGNWCQHLFTQESPVPITARLEEKSFGGENSHVSTSKQAGRKWPWGRWGVLPGGHLLLPLTEHPQPLLLKAPHLFPERVTTGLSCDPGLASHHTSPTAVGKPGPWAPPTTGPQTSAAASGKEQLSRHWVVS